jgi:Domain of unknown function (DUF4440)
MSVETTEKELLGLERAFWEALKRKDAKAATRLTDFPCIVTGPQGVASPDEQTFANMVKSEHYSIEHVYFGDGAKVRLLGDDVAIVAYNVREELTVDGKPVTLQAVDSSTWIRRNGQWRMAAAQDSLERIRALAPAVAYLSHDPPPVTLD